MSKIEEIRSAQFGSEREVETKFIVPLLELLGYPRGELAEERTIANVPEVFVGAKKKQHRRPDFIVYDEGKEDTFHALFIVEAKDPDKVPDPENDPESVAQAWAYATALLTPYYVLSNGKTTLVYKRLTHNKTPGKDPIVNRIEQKSLDDTILSDLGDTLNRVSLRLKKKRLKAEWSSIDALQAKATATDFVETVSEFIPLLKGDIESKYHLTIKQKPELARKFAELNSPNVQKLSDNPTDDIVLRAAYNFLFKLLFAKIYEDKPGFGYSFHFKQTTLKELEERRNKSLASFVAGLVREAFDGAKEFYSRLFEPNELFDNLWPSDEIMAKLVREISRYNFRNVDNDMLGDVYHRALMAHVTQREKGAFAAKVDIMLALNAELVRRKHEIASPSTRNDKQIEERNDEAISRPYKDWTTEKIKDKIAQTDAEIDVMVYKLYELTYDEVLIIDPDFKMKREEYDSFRT